MMKSRTLTIKSSHCLIGLYKNHHCGKTLNMQGKNCPACITFAVHTSPSQVCFLISFIPLKPWDLDSLQAEELHTLLMRRYDTYLTLISIFLSSVARNRDHGSSFSSVVPAVVCIVCHQITISLAVGGRETVAPSVHMVVLKHMASSCFFIRTGR